MKKVLIFFLFLLSSILLFANQDSSEIYLTKKSFINNQPDYTSDYFVKEKYWLGWSGFSFQAKGVLALKLNKSERQEFTPGSIFGFKTNEIKYVYNSSGKNYIAVLTENNAINFFVGEKEKNIYGGLVVDDIFFYSKNINGNMRIFNKENIYKDFEYSPMLPALLNLESELKKRDLDKDMHIKQFKKAKKLVEDTLSKFKP